MNRREMLKASALLALSSAVPSAVATPPSAPQLPNPPPEPIGFSGSEAVVIVAGIDVRKSFIKMQLSDGTERDLGNFNVTMRQIRELAKRPGNYARILGL